MVTMMTAWDVEQTAKLARMYRTMATLYRSLGNTQRCRHNLTDKGY